MNKIIRESIGIIPIKPAPLKNEIIQFKVEGVPPIKQWSFSLRNIKSSQYQAFEKLRIAALAAMNERAWYEDEIILDITIYMKDISKVSLNPYVGGIMDTLGGSHGFAFTFSPIIYQADMQVTAVTYDKKQSNIDKYSIKVTLL